MKYNIGLYLSQQVISANTNTLKWIVFNKESNERIFVKLGNPMFIEGNYSNYNYDVYVEYNNGIIISHKLKNNLKKLIINKLNKIY